MFISTYIRAARNAALVAASCTLVACGGGGGSAGTSPFGSSGGDASLAQRCSPSNPYRGDATATTSTGSLATERSWLRSYIDDAYLWYDKVPAVDTASYNNDTSQGFMSSIVGYFDALTNIPEDRFSFVYSTKAWKDLANSGVSLSYGAEWVIGSTTAPYNVRIGYVDPNSPASTTTLMRGDTIESINGTQVNQLSYQDLRAHLYPSSTTQRSFVFSRGGTNLAAVSMSPANVVKKPVLDAQVVDVGGQKVGYMVFNDHLLPAEAQLIDAINTFKNQQVSDLVLDLRYNGGGFLYLASELAYMIAGPGITYTNGTSKTFEKLQYNSKRTNDNARPATPFINTSCFPNASFQCTNQQSLPTLNLSRVYVLTSGGTCSASESVINGLRGVDVQVHLVGTTTCGKPYGFTARDNCGLSYFPIEFKGVNAKGFGDYASGFAATCTAGDDLSHLLGDTSEAKFATALYMRANDNACPPSPLGVSKEAFAAAKQGQPLSDGTVVREPVRENRVHLGLQR